MRDGGPVPDRTVTGRYVFVPSPCTTRPCLPGMAYAVSTEGGELLFVTVAGQWSDQARHFGACRPQLGDELTLTGRVGHRVDALGRPFSVIEVRSAAHGRPTTRPTTRPPTCP